jgi:Reverse transcriptase (RNA-dependent DNA polymerase)/Endonuclease-reverse transcriptase
MIYENVYVDKNNRLKMMLHNATGLASKINSIKRRMQDEQIDVCAITETWIKPGNTLDKWIGSSSIASQCSSRGHKGVAILINPRARERLGFKQLYVDPEGRAVVAQMQDLVLIALYLSPADDNVECLKIMNSLINDYSARLNGRIMLIGDFNCHHKALGDKESNARGRLLIPELINQGFKLRNEIGEGQKTFHRDDCESYTLDLVWTRNVNMWLDVEARRDMFLGAGGHVPLTFGIVSAKQQTLQKSKQIPKVQLENLEVREKRDSFLETIKPEMARLKAEVRERLRVLKESSTESTKKLSHTVQGINDSIYKQFNEIVMSSAKTSFGLKNTGRRSDADGLREPVHINKIYNKMQAAHKLSRKFPETERLTRLRDSLECELRSAREKWKKETWTTYTKQLASGNTKTQQKAIKRIVRGKSARSNALQSDPETITGAQQHFRNLFRHNPNATRHPGKEWVPSDEEAQGIAETLFSSQEVKNVLQNLARNKSPGPSGLPNELLALAGPEVAKVLSPWFQFCMVSGTIPSAWKHAVIIPVPKKGDLSMIQNYRPISLLETTRKVYEVLLLQGIKDDTKPVSVYQGGFRSQRSTLDQIVCLQECMNMFKAKDGKYPVVAYLDIKAAYDSVDRNRMLDKCQEHGFKNPIIESIRQLFDFNQATVSINGYHSKTFDMPNGVQQGSILSPLLYSIFINDLIPKLRKGPAYSKSCGINMNCLLYADDIVLVAKNEKDMSELLKICEEHAKENNYLFNTSKSAFTRDPMDNMVKLSLHGIEVPFVKNFCYLGIQFNYKGIDKREQIAATAEKITKSVNFFKHLGMHGGGFHLKTKVSIYKSFIRSRMEYGLLILKLNKAEIRELESMQQKALCEMMSVSKTTSAVTLRVITGLPTMGIRRSILRTKFVERYKGLESEPGILLPKVNAWVRSVGLRCIADEIVEEVTENEQEILSRSKTDILALSKYTRGKIEEEKQKIEWFQRGPLRDCSAMDLSKTLMDWRIDKKTMRVVTLYLLKKFPGKPTKCARCGELTNKEHIITCNEQLWESTIRKSKWYQRTGANLPEVKHHIPQWMMAIAAGTKARKQQEEILTNLSSCILKSMKICSPMNITEQG